MRDSHLRNADWENKVMYLWNTFSDNLNMLMLRRKHVATSVFRDARNLIFFLWHVCHIQLTSWAVRNVPLLTNPIWFVFISDCIKSPNSGWMNLNKKRNISGLTTDLLHFILYNTYYFPLTFKSFLFFALFICFLPQYPAPSVWFIWGLFQNSFVFIINNYYFSFYFLNFIIFNDYFYI